MKKGLQYLSTALVGQMVYMNSGVIGFGSPGMGMTKPVNKDQQDTGIAQPPY
jgi:hypothetical protein